MYKQMKFKCKMHLFSLREVLNGLIKNRDGGRLQGILYYKIGYNVTTDIDLKSDSSEYAIIRYK